MYALSPFRGRGEGEGGMDNNHKVALRKQLRRRPTKSESLVWRLLRNRHLGYKFRRQYGIGDFIVDFCCPELHLIIELDGFSHQDENIYYHDIRRQSFLESRGFNVARFPDDYVLKNADGFLTEIKNLCSTLSDPHPNPLPKRERGLIKIGTMTTFQELKKRMLKNPKVRKHYEALEPEFAIIESRIRKRLKKEKTSKALDAKLKISIT